MTPVVWIFGAKNGDFLITVAPLLEDPPEHPRLQLLRRRERLDQVVASGRTEFEKIILLRRWVHGLWSFHEKPFYYPPWDAEEIIDLARRHGNYGFCAQYSIVFVQACRALGMHARYVDIGHFLTDVWSNEYNHWVVMDPTNDIHYEMDGEPLDGLSLNLAAEKGRIKGIQKVSSDGSRTAATPEDIAGYQNFSLLISNNQLSDPVLIQKNGTKMRLGLERDYHDYPMVGRDNIGYGSLFLAWQGPQGRDDGLGKLKSSDRDDFDDAFNQTIIFVIRKNPLKGTLKLKLIKEQAPGFQEFVLTHNGVSAGSTERDEVVLKNLHPGLNIFTARIRTRYGWLGRESSLRFFYKPNLFKRRP